jgi:hypothetical protein
VVDAFVAIGGSVSGATADIGEGVEPADDDPAHDAASSETTASTSEPITPCVKLRPESCALLIAAISFDTM